ncbi:SCO7613 C-terminal domain-containing membrane protein [Blastococcus sp. PRF04-17]|uniref:SCO7613 C-terminal domain-containing membrane protein n=1 Tax=Blastococcus sp. PRF04-17 TaxID=2933797 RepID=UPI001FF3F486|nr:hypothetical protein [Blastococcus sp. PRF04-17]UOY02128.1 hypothetical protein MVA48_01710 [Blastococcus sp. PRF04-17]
MSQPVETARPPQVLLAVGAVLLVSAGAAVASAYGGLGIRLLLLALAAVAGVTALGAARTRLRSSQEALAACAAGLALAGSAPGGPSPAGDRLPVAVLALVFLGLRLLAPTTAAWPLASWIAAQLAVLRGLDAVPAVLHTVVVLCVALVGLAIALFGRRLVARTALITAAPWWLTGVVGGSSSAWADDGAERWLSAALMIAAAFGLLVARLRAALEPLLGPPRLVPVVAGVVAGVATTGALSSLGFLAMTLTGYAGVLIANTAAATLTGWRRGLFLPAALAAGTVMASLCVAQLLLDARWSELCLLLVLTAVPTVVVAVRRPDDRPVSLPVAVLCLAGAALLALPDGLLSPDGAAVALTALYAGAMAVGAELERDSRRATARAAALCAVAAALVLLAERQPSTLAIVLAVQGAFTLGWAWRTGTRQSEDDAAARRIGAALLVLAFWISAGAAGLAAVEWYSLPAAAALLVASGPALRRDASWPAWGPGLLVAAVPSGVLAVVVSDGARAVCVLTAAGLVMVAGARYGLRAPLMVGAGTALALAVGFTARALPWPLAAALVVGSALLAVGVRRERRPVAGFTRRVADLR